MPVQRRTARLLLVVLALVARPVLAGDGVRVPFYGVGAWHLQLGPAREVTAVFHDHTVYPHLDPLRWILVASCPPETQSQQPLACSYVAQTRQGPLAGKLDHERHAPGRAYVRIAFPAGRSVVRRGYAADATYRVRLHERHLVP